MISYALTVTSIFLANLVPAYFAIYIVTNLKQIKKRYLAAIGLGLTFWFFLDTMNDAAQLDANESFTGGIAHFGIVSVFVVGIIALGLFDHFAVPKPTLKSTNATKLSVRSSESFILIPIGVAVVMAVHGLGEGWDFASVASEASTQSLATTFGGLSPLISYPAHKFLEATIVAVLYVSFVNMSEVSQSKNWQLLVLGLLFSTGSLIGAIMGYKISLDTSYFFAFGVTAALYATVRLSEVIDPRFNVGDDNPIYLGGWIFIAIAVGLLLLYSAALLH